MITGTAVVRGKGIPTRTFSSEAYESQGEFMERVVQIYSDPDDLAERNTLTFEFIFEDL